MANLSPVQKLDFVLDKFRETKGAVSEEVIFKAINPDNMYTMYYDPDELKRILIKLVDDKYIYQDIEMDDIYYAITYEGHLFHGYEKQLKIDRISYRRRNVREFVLSWGTALAGTYGLFEILKWAFHHFHWVLPT